MSNPLKVAIVGKAPSSFGLAPYDDESWEIWTLADLVLAGQAKRWTRHFEIHPPEWVEERSKPYWEWLIQKHDKPVYMREAYEQVQDSVAYPKDRIVEQFGTYFNNTVSWMIALAIAEAATELGIYGVDMAQNSGGELNGEYAHQRPSCEHFLGWARGAGIKVYIPPEADLLKVRSLYGFDTEMGQMEKKWKTRTEELKKRVTQKEQQRDQAALEAAFLQGALESQNYYQQWLQGGG